MTPCSDCTNKFPEASFCVICPSIGFGNCPVSGRRVTLTRSPTASTLNAFANDSKIAIVPPKEHSYSMSQCSLLTRGEQLCKASCRPRHHGSGFRRRGESHFNFAYFHLRNVRSQLDPGLRDLRLKCFPLGLKVRLIRVVPDPNKLVLRPVHPRADNRHADSLVHCHDFLFEVLEERVHLALVDRVNANL